MWSSKMSLKSVTFNFLIDCKHHLQNFLLQQTPLTLLNWFQRDRAVASLTVPGGQEFHFPHFFLWFQSNFSYFSSYFTYFLPHFGPPGGRLPHPGRPWLRHCKDMGSWRVAKTIGNKEVIWFGYILKSVCKFWLIFLDHITYVFCYIGQEMVNRVE